MPNHNKGKLDKLKFQGPTLKMYREAHGFTQMQLALVAGLRNRISVAMWEDPKKDNAPADHQIQAIADTFDVSVNVFYQPFDLEFKELWDSDIKAFCIRAMNGDDMFAKRLALDFYKHVYRGEWEDKKAVEQSEGMSLADFMGQNQPPPSEDETGTDTSDDG